jgi:hypothetical protein
VSRTARGARPKADALARVRDGYFEASRRPLETLFFLLPMVVLYEVGLSRWLTRGGEIVTNKAHGGVVRLFEIAGVRPDSVGVPLLALPAAGLLATIVAWQLIGRFPWSMRWSAVAGMWLESALLALPLIPLGLLSSGAGRGLMGAMAGPAIEEMDRTSRALMAVGAGVYEELVFRMGIMSAVHMLLSDVAEWKGAGAWITAMVVAAVLFALYHPVDGLQGAALWWRHGFMLAAGLWFGTVFHWRGFGVAAGTHALYDIMALLR